MKIVLSGGEKGSYRRTLLANDVPAIGLNITQFAVPKTKAVDLKELAGGADVYVYTSKDDEDLDKYDLFLRTHHEDITCVIGRPDYDGTWLGDKYVPLWNDHLDLERLADLCERYGRVAISDDAITPKTIKRLQSLQQRWGCLLIGMTSKIDHVEAIKWDVVIVTSWTSVVRFGETQVWDGHSLRRYPAQKKESARKKHRADIVRLGIDYEAVSEDDVTEVSKLAIRSWMTWADKTNGTPGYGAYHPFDGSGDEDEFTLETAEVASTPPEEATSGYGDSPLPALATEESPPRHERERSLLPVLGIETATTVGTTSDTEGNETIEIDPHRDDVVSFSSDGLRQCDTCYLAPKCPRFEEHASCAYSIPIELKTKEQLQGLLRAMLEMQGSRIMFASFAEGLEGQGIDPVLSTEMDRLFRLTEQFKSIEDTRDMVRIEMEAKGSSGVLSRIFGTEAAAPQHQLSMPLDTPAIDGIILDAEVLDSPPDPE